MLSRDYLAPHALARWAAETPDTVCLERVDGDGGILTFAELLTQSLRFADALSRLGVGRGTHVATFLPLSFDAHRVMLALGWLRAVEVPINPAFKGRLLHYGLELADVTILLTTAELGRRVAELDEPLPLLERVVVLDGDEAEAAGAWATLGRGAFLEGAEPRPQEGPEYRDTAALLFTSGTTGPSKAVITPWAVIGQFWSFPPPDTVGPGEGIFCAMPMFHNSGRGAFNGALQRGAKLALREKFSATHVWDDVRRTDAVVLALVGPMTALIYSAEPSEHDRDHPVRTVICGPMIPEIEDFERRFGVRVMTCYGQTETGIPLATGWDHGPWATCGKPRTDYPWIECRVADEWDEPVAPGVVGELLCRSPEPWSMNAGYYKMPEATAAAWRNGWYHTGDAFSYDEDGWFYFADRMKDTIRRRGENISSYEVETLVAEYPDVIECAAVPVPAKLGEDECLVFLLVRDPGAFDPVALIEFLVPRMPRYMIPRYVEVVEGDLPRNETSMRVRKFELRQRGVGPRTWDREAAGVTV